VLAMIRAAGLVHRAAVLLERLARRMALGDWR
jgi:hypothetical protein